MLRLGLGVMFLAHAGLKLWVFSLAGTAQFFQSIGLPALPGYVVFTAGLAGGVLLVLGLFSRWVALALMPILLGTQWVHAPNGGWECPAFLAAAFAQFLLGDGAYPARAVAAR